MLAWDFIGFFRAADAVVCLLQGKLEGTRIAECGLAAQVKAQAPEDSGANAPEPQDIPVRP